MYIKMLLAGAVFLLSSGNVFAQSAAFTKAANGWLNGEELENLLTLSDLAKNGDTDAQLLLGQIDRDRVPGGYSDLLVMLDETERSSLLRSGEIGDTINWLLNLTDPKLAPLGEAIFNYRIGRDPIGDALALQKNGEATAAEYVVWNTLNNGRFDLVNSIPAESFGLSSAGFLVWMTNYMAGENKALTMKRLVADPSPDKIKGLLAVKRLARMLNMDHNFSAGVEQLIEILLAHGYALPEDANLVNLNADIRRLAEVDDALSLAVRACDKCTSDSVDYECIIQSLEIVNGYKTLLSIRTPVETVIPEETFIASDRAVTIFENLLKTRSHYYKRPIRSACIADFLAN